jgi:hypothetical protein
MKKGLSLALGIVVACGGGNDNLPPPPPPPPPPPATAIATAPPPAVEDAGPPAPPPLPAVALVPGAASPDPAAPLPTVKFAAPAKDQVVAADKAGPFEVKLDVKSWQTATGSQHVHLILDNKPYKAVYDTKQPVKLNELAGGEAIAEGQHVLVAFPSRANHESVKTKDALAMVQFWVGKKGEAKDAKTDLKKPMLVYSRPKGDYKGEMASHVLIDFQLANVTLAEGKEHVAITVIGAGIDKELTAKAEKFGTPFYLDNLRDGSYTLKLELKDKDGKLVEGPWNSTTRKIMVDREAPADPMPGMTHGDAGAPADAGKPASGAGAGKPAAGPGDAGAKK